jgi:hypothetical protein
MQEEGLARNQPKEAGERPAGPQQGEDAEVGAGGEKRPSPLLHSLKHHSGASALGTESLGSIRVSPVS